MTHSTELQQLRLIRADLSRLIEPGDLLGATAVQALGPGELHRLITGGTNPTAQQQQKVGDTAEASGLGPRQRSLEQGLARWRTRLGQLNAAEQLRAIGRLSGGLLIPEDEAWPQQLEDLHPGQPLALWYRGEPSLRCLPQPGRSIALVGAREMTDYGGRIAWEIAAELAGHGLTVLSGGAYGIDAAAHRGALNRAQECPRSPTLAVLAGGVDRLYPAGNEKLLRQIQEQGLLLSEMAPGSAPTKSRFLHRNRLIAALAAATVVVQARWRSGALSTANHALNIGRAVGAVPGSILEPASAGCHRLLQETPARLITDAADAAQLISGHLEPTHAQNGEPAPTEEEKEPAQDQLTEVQDRIFDALPVRKYTAPGKLAEVAGLPIPTVLTTLTKLQRLNLAEAANGHWRKGR